MTTRHLHGLGPSVNTHTNRSGLHCAAVRSARWCPTVPAAGRRATETNAANTDNTSPSLAPNNVSINHGPNQADAPAEREGGKKKAPVPLDEWTNGGGCGDDETALSARNSGSERDPTLPKNGRLAHSKSAVPATRSRDCARNEKGRAVSVDGPPRASRGCRDAPHSALRGHELVRAPCEAGNRDAQGHAIGQAHPRRTVVKRRTALAARWVHVPRYGNNAHDSLAAPGVPSAADRQAKPTFAMM